MTFQNCHSCAWADLIISPFSLSAHLNSENLLKSALSTVTTSGSTGLLTFGWNTYAPDTYVWMIKKKRNKGYLILYVII